MRPRGLVIAVCLIGTMLTSGCALFLIGAGAAGGYAVSRDSVINHFDKPKAHVFRRSAAVIKEMGGEITIEDESNGLLRAHLHEATVTITVKPLTKKTVELKVKARKTGMPAVAVAQEVYDKILPRL